MTKRLFHLAAATFALVLAGGLLAGCELEDLCGNGTVDVGEDCDDGNTADNDGCSSLCLHEIAEGEGEGEGEDPGEGEGEGEDPGEGEGEGEEPAEGEGEGEGEGGWDGKTFRWLRICSLTMKGDSNQSPATAGPDIDAVMVTDAAGNVKGYATQAPASAQNIFPAGEGNEHADPAAMTGAPDQTYGTGANAANCQGFTSLGMKGHWAVLGVEGFDILGDADDASADRLTIYEVPNCRGDFDDAKSEPSHISMAASSDGDTWVAVEPNVLDGGEVEFKVRPWDGGASVECEPCGGDAECTF